MYKNILAIILLLYAVFGEGLFDKLDKPTPSPTPNPTSEILDVEKPSENILKDVQAFSDLITEPSDRAKIAIFNYEFAERILTYNSTVQQTNDVYSLAGKIFFKNSLVNKYDGLAEKIQNILESILTEENHILTIEEKKQINQYFMGIAWILIQKRW